MPLVPMGGINIDGISFKEAGRFFGRDIQISKNSSRRRIGMEERPADHETKDYFKGDPG